MATITTIEIPGSFMARVVNGRIIGYTFSPHAAYAGYFGDAKILIEGEDISDDDFFAMVEPTLMSSSDNKTSTFVCEWSE